MSDQDTKILAAFLSMRDAEADYHARLKYLFPVGAGVTWFRNWRFCSGTVLQHGYGDRLKVRNDATGRSYWIDGFHIVDAIRQKQNAQVAA